MTHTKGPWNVGEDNDVFSDEECIAQVVNAPENIPEAVANARLIAAAPVLYAALQEAYEALKDIVNASDNGQAYTDDELKTVFSPICDLTYTALAQADGKEQPCSPRSA